MTTMLTSDSRSFKTNIHALPSMQENTFSINDTLFGGYRKSSTSRDITECNLSFYEKLLPREMLYCASRYVYIRRLKVRRYLLQKES